MTAGALPGDPRFFARSGPHSLAAVIAVTGGGLPANAPPPDMLLTGVAPLQTAGPSEVSFLDNKRYAQALTATNAGAVIVAPNMVDRVPATSVAIVTDEPYLGWAHVASLFHPSPPTRPGRHPTSVIDPSATVDPSAEIGPFVVVGAAAEIGPRCRVGPGAVIGDGVVLGSDCRVGAHASVSHTIAGARVYIYTGARIGQDGFGFAFAPHGFVTVPQLGRVILEDDVEIGANSTVDRGSAQDTVIGTGSRLDNLVQIGHNVRLGRCCVIVSQAGVSGSTVLEDFVMLGGQAGLTGHLHIGRKARIGAQAGVMADVPADTEVLGSPAQPLRVFFRQVAALRRLAGGGRRGNAGPGEAPETTTAPRGAADGADSS